jgi:uncharacterized protein (TIGR02449 family)
MDELFLDIETSIRRLMEKQSYLKKTNEQLNQSRMSLTREKERLLLKQKNLAKSIEGMITHLKSIEGIS